MWLNPFRGGEFRRPARAGVPLLLPMVFPSEGLTERLDALPALGGLLPPMQRFRCAPASLVRPNIPADRPPDVATELIPDHVFGPSAPDSSPDQLCDALGSTALGGDACVTSRTTASPRRVPLSTDRLDGEAGTGGGGILPASLALRFSASNALRSANAACSPSR